jgi:hypothetical protein
MALRKVQTTSILKWSIIAKLSAFLDFPLIFLSNLLDDLGKWFRTY